MTTLTIAIVYQAVRCESSSHASDRRSHSGVLRGFCFCKACTHEILASLEGLEPHRQEVALRRPIHKRLVRTAGDDQQSYQEAEGKA